MSEPIGDIMSLIDKGHGLITISHSWTVSDFMFFQLVTVYHETYGGTDRHKTFIQVFGDARKKTKCPFCGTILKK